jgi:hypothetical protein
MSAQTWSSCFADWLEACKHCCHTSQGLLFYIFYILLCCIFCIFCVFIIFYVFYISCIFFLFSIFCILCILKIFCRVSAGTPQSRHIVDLNMDSQAPFPGNEENGSAHKHRKTNAESLQTDYSSQRGAASLLTVTISMRTTMQATEILKKPTDCWAGPSRED